MPPTLHNPPPPSAAFAAQVLRYGKIKILFFAARRHFQVAHDPSSVIRPSRPSSSSTAAAVSPRPGKKLLQLDKVTYHKYHLQLLPLDSTSQVGHLKRTCPPPFVRDRLEVPCRNALSLRVKIFPSTPWPRKRTTTCVHVTPCRAIPRADGHSPHASPSVRVRLCGGARLAGGEDIRDHVVSSALLLVDAFPPSLDRRSPATNSPNLRPFLLAVSPPWYQPAGKGSLCLSECQTAACSSGVQTTCRPAVWQ